MTPTEVLGAWKAGADFVKVFPCSLIGADNYIRTLKRPFPEIPLMEDVALCKRLKRVGAPLCLSERVITSGRRWEQNGVINTVILMWRLRLAYAFGADPSELARQYGYE